MKLLFKQRFLSLLDSYDVYDEDGTTVFQVEGQFALGHKCVVYDARGNELGTVKQVLLTFLPRFDIYVGDELKGTISKELSIFKPKYDIDFNGWYIEGDFFEWDYSIFDANGNCIATISKELLKLTDTYSIDVSNPDDALDAMLFVIAIDAEKCSRN